MQSSSAITADRTALDPRLLGRIRIVIARVAARRGSRRDLVVLFASKSNPGCRIEERVSREYSYSPLRYRRRYRSWRATPSSYSAVLVVVVLPVSLSPSSSPLVVVMFNAQLPEKRENPCWRTIECGNRKVPNRGKVRQLFPRKFYRLRRSCPGKSNADKYILREIGVPTIKPPRTLCDGWYVVYYIVPSGSNRSGSNHLNRFSRGNATTKYSRAADNTSPVVDNDSARKGGRKIEARVVP